MQVNIVQTFSTTTSTNAKETTKSSNEKDFNEVLKAEQETNEVKNEKPKEETKTEENSKDSEVNDEIEASVLAVMMPNVKEILDNIKNQHAELQTKSTVEGVSAEILENPIQLEQAQALELEGETEEGKIKILDVNLLKSEAEMPEELLSKVNALSKSLENSKTDTNSNSDFTNNMLTENTQVATLENQPTNTTNVFTNQITSQVGQTMSSEYVNEINNQIADNIAIGKNDFTIQLTPENLGTLTIKASFEDGKSIVSIICTDLKTLEVVQKSADDLALIMQNKTGNETQVVVESPKSDYLDNQNEHTDNKGQNHQQENKKEETAENPQDFLQQLRLGLTQV